MRKTLFFILALMLMLTACGPQTQASEAVDTPVAPEAATATNAPAEPAATAAAPAAPTEAPDEAPPVTVTPRAEMEATDPDTVVLASGQPQLIEFFAFW